MKINPAEIARIITLEAGLGFRESHGCDGGDQWIELEPISHSPANTFAMRTIIDWRHIEIFFIPGAFSGKLLNIMNKSSRESRSLFIGILEHGREEGASVLLEINNKLFDYKDSELWETDWTNVEFGFRVGQLNLSDEVEIDSQNIVQDCVGRMAAAVISLMPVDTDIQNERYAEGACIAVKVNRFERDPRSRAAALSIHGYACKGCGLLMSDLYGGVANGFIEVHHTKPVSELGEDYLINPAKDLLPLCPNCHSIVHRINPPYTLNELKEILANNGSQ